MSSLPPPNLQRPFHSNVFRCRPPNGSAVQPTGAFSCQHRWRLQTLRTRRRLGRRASGRRRVGCNGKLGGISRSLWSC